MCGLFYSLFSSVRILCTTQNYINGKNSLRMDLLKIDFWGMPFFYDVHDYYFLFLCSRTMKCRECYSKKKKKT